MLHLPHLLKKESCHQLIVVQVLKSNASDYSLNSVKATDTDIVYKEAKTSQPSRYRSRRKIQMAEQLKDWVVSESTSKSMNN